MTIVYPGRPYPLGATWDGAGTNFAIYSENATEVELCLFDSTSAKQEALRTLQPIVRQPPGLPSPRSLLIPNPSHSAFSIP